MSRGKTILGLCGWLLACFAAAAIGGFFMPGEWYASLKKPAWNPPGWLFGPVWTALYTMMAVAAWLVWRQGGWGKQRNPLLVFLVQLALIAAWTPLLFCLHRPGGHTQPVSRPNGRPPAHGWPLPVCCRDGLG